MLGGGVASTLPPIDIVLNKDTIVSFGLKKNYYFTSISAQTTRSYLPLDFPYRCPAGVHKGGRKCGEGQ